MLLWCFCLPPPTTSEHNFPTQFWWNQYLLASRLIKQFFTSLCRNRYLSLQQSQSWYAGGEYSTQGAGVKRTMIFVSTKYFSSYPRWYCVKWIEVRKLFGWIFQWRYWIHQLQRFPTTIVMYFWIRSYFQILLVGEFQQHHHVALLAIQHRNKKQITQVQILSLIRLLLKV